MKIQLSPIKTIPDALVVWNEPTPDTDIVMDLKNLTFAPGKIEEIYSFHILDHLFSNEIDVAISNWKKMLQKGGKLYTVTDDFEHLARKFVGGEMDVKEFNENHSHPTYFRKESMIDIFIRAGFLLDNIIIWFADVTGKFAKAEHELVFSITKHD